MKQAEFDTDVCTVFEPPNNWKCDHTREGGTIPSTYAIWQSRPNYGMREQKTRCAKVLINQEIMSDESGALREWHSQIFLLFIHHSYVSIACWTVLKKLKTFAFSIISQHFDFACGLRRPPILVEVHACLSYIVNNMAPDVLATHGVKFLPAISLTKNFVNVGISKVRLMRSALSKLRDLKLLLNYVSLDGLSLHQKLHI